jgi:hypothetical protein
MSQTSIFDHIGEPLTSSQAASLVNPTQVLENDLERRTNATCGPKCLEQLERFNHVGSWAKMFSELLIGMGGWYSKRCALTWKLKGTRFNRLYFQLVQSTPHTSDKEFGLLLTPTVVQTDEPPEKMRERAERNGYKNGTKYGSLLSQVKYGEMLPTPTMFDYNSARTPEKYEEDKARYAEKGVNLQMPGKITGKENQNSVTKVIRSQTGTTSQLNPPFVAEMMGFPTDWTILPFLSGETNQSKPTGTQ